MTPPKPPQFPSKTVLSFVYTCLVEPLVFLVVLFLYCLMWLPLWSLRQLVVATSKLFVPGIGAPLSAKDVCLYENVNKRHAFSIVVILGLNGDISAQTTRELFLRNVLQSKVEEEEEEEEDSTKLRLRFPQLTQFQTTFLGYPFWRNDPQFDIKNHIHQVFHDAPDTPEHFKSVEGAAGEFGGRPYPPRRSPWEMWIVRNFPADEVDGDGTRNKKTIVIYRCHHSQMDAYSIVNMLHQLSGKPPIVVPSAYILKQKNHRSSLFGTSWWSVMRDLLDYCLQSGLEMRRHRQFKQVRLDEKRKGEGEEEVVVRDKVHFGNSAPLPLIQVRAVANKFGVRVPAVLSTLLAEAISELFQGQLGNVNAPFVIPLPGRGPTASNHASFSALLLPTSKTMPLATKLQVVNKSYLELASHPSIVALQLVENIVGNCPAGLSRFFAKNLHYSPISISNFSIGHENYKFGSLDVADFQGGIGVLGDVTASMSMILGYKDQVRILFAGHDSLYSEANVKRVAAATLENLETLMSMDA